MLKSIGRSSHSWAESLAALSPRDLFTARRLIRLFIALFSAAMTTGGVFAGVAMRPCALTFQPSNHSFIQLFELQLPAFRRGRIVAMTCRRIIQEPRS